MQVFHQAPMIFKNSQPEVSVERSDKLTRQLFEKPQIEKSNYSKTWLSRKKMLLSTSQKIGRENRSLNNKNCPLLRLDKFDELILPSLRARQMSSLTPYLNEYDLNILFNDLLLDVNNLKISGVHVPSCIHQAKRIANALAKRGITAKKIVTTYFSKEDGVQVTVPSRNNSGTWNFHTAAVIDVKNRSGNIVQYVLDPLYSGKPQPIEEWKKGWENHYSSFQLKHKIYNFGDNDQSSIGGSLDLPYIDQVKKYFSDAFKIASGATISLIGEVFLQPELYVLGNAIMVYTATNPSKDMSEDRNDEKRSVLKRSEGLNPNLLFDQKLTAIQAGHTEDIDNASTYFLTNIARNPENWAGTLKNEGAIHTLFVPGSSKVSVLRFYPKGTFPNSMNLQGSEIDLSEYLIGEVNEIDLNNFPEIQAAMERNDRLAIAQLVSRHIKDFNSKLILIPPNHQSVFIGGVYHEPQQTNMYFFNVDKPNNDELDKIQSIDPNYRLTNDNMPLLKVYSEDKNTVYFGNFIDEIEIPNNLKPALAHRKSTFMFLAKYKGNTDDVESIRVANDKLVNNPTGNGFKEMPFADSILHTNVIGNAHYRRVQIIPQSKDKLSVQDTGIKFWNSNWKNKDANEVWGNTNAFTELAALLASEASGDDFYESNYFTALDARKANSGNTLDGSYDSAPYGDHKVLTYLDGSRVLSFSPDRGSVLKTAIFEKIEELFPEIKSLSSNAITVRAFLYLDKKGRPYGIDLTYGYQKTPTQESFKSSFLYIDPEDHSLKKASDQYTSFDEAFGLNGISKNNTITGITFKNETPKTIGRINSTPENIAFLDAEFTNIQFPFTSSQNINFGNYNFGLSRWQEGLVGVPDRDNWVLGYLSHNGQANVVIPYKDGSYIRQANHQEIKRALIDHDVEWGDDRNTNGAFIFSPDHRLLGLRFMDRTHTYGGDVYTYEHMGNGQFRETTLDHLKSKVSTQNLGKRWWRQKEPPEMNRNFVEAPSNLQFLDISHVSASRHKPRVTYSNISSWKESKSIISKGKSDFIDESRSRRPSENGRGIVSYEDSFIVGADHTDIKRALEDHNIVWDDDQYTNGFFIFEKVAPGYYQLLGLRFVDWDVGPNDDYYYKYLGNGKFEKSSLSALKNANLSLDLSQKNWGDNRGIKGRPTFSSGW